MRNLDKHGMSFETACDVFFDPFVMIVEVQEVEGELRTAMIGMTTQWNVLYVVHTVRAHGVYRLISARRATRTERRHYENQ